MMVFKPVAGLKLAEVRTIVIPDSQAVFNAEVEVFFIFTTRFCKAYEASALDRVSLMAEMEEPFTIPRAVNSDARKSICCLSPP